MTWSLTPSDIIEIIGIIASLTVSIVAIVISLKTLKQAQITNSSLTCAMILSLPK